MTKYLLLSLGCMALLATSAFGAAAPCANGNFASYVSLGSTGCTIDQLVFFNFHDSPTANPAGLAIPDTGINLQPTFAPGTPNFAGFAITSGWSVASDTAGNSSFQDNFITYSVSSTSGAAIITDVHLDFNGTFSGTGSSTVSEQVCVGGTSTAACTGTLLSAIQITNSGAGNVPMNSVLFTATSSIGVSKDINVTSGTAGNGHISTVDNTVSYGAGGTTSVPEPLSFVLLGSGLLGLGLLRKRLS